LAAEGFVRTVALRPQPVDSYATYPFNIPAVAKLGTLKLNPRITILVGENGSGKSTLIEAIAVAAGFNAEGGSKNFFFSTRASHSNLHDCLQIARGPYRETDGFFLRAESLFNVATQIDVLNRDGAPLLPAYGGTSLHEQSHGESFIALIGNRFRGNGLYILDEPEAALSPSRQLMLLSLMDILVQQKRSQFLIATHSPIIMAYPGATIYLLDQEGIRRVEYEETEHFRITRDFLNGREAIFRHLFSERKST
jgi:predicted ATPase